MGRYEIDWDSQPCFTSGAAASSHNKKPIESLSSFSASDWNSLPSHRSGCVIGELGFRLGCAQLVGAQPLLQHNTTSKVLGIRTLLLESRSQRTMTHTIRQPQERLSKPNTMNDSN